MVIKSKFVTASSLAADLGVFGAMVGIWIPIIYFCILRFLAGEPLPEAQINAIQFYGSVFAIALSLLSILFSFVTSYMFYDEIKRYKEKHGVS